MAWGKPPGSIDVEEEINWVRKPTPPGKRLSGARALVTGASRGFGRAIALALANEGADVIVNYIKSEDDAKRVVKEIKDIGQDAVAIQADVSKYQEVKRMAEEIWETWGRLDVLINNAGTTAPRQTSWRELSDEVVNETLDLDLKGTYYCLYEFGSRMLDLQRSGTIVNIASNVITTGSPRSPIYAAAKYGIIGLTKTFALALAPFVRVNAVAPGYMDTPSLRARKDWTEERKKWIIQHTPLRSLGKPENIAYVVVFLASQDSLHITGETIFCDGGFTMAAI
ncbi:beta-ketoacyl-ACP reductase [Sulfodiicoccus acidiphilus]|uniref:Beta-ketoacyl-ACP reductase n=1 Tax=Sulfodiicoccus acidiphilus TaxID=1670455 RepID=A0A348B1K8_9CREN|nr:3-oxoacyl-ACP reductase family protein [Sulfodiicoccus acidiphilus]BBD72060.1 beta-ketoacyl-ACP reductase [Sulfodiicoccus acidiphilus]GGU00064.1 beta-ketoacyl-ACP reductase [Sulfodiicoccus acidiphilus]